MNFHIINIVSVSDESAITTELAPYAGVAVNRYWSYPTSQKPVY